MLKELFNGIYTIGLGVVLTIGENAKPVIKTGGKLLLDKRSRKLLNKALDLNKPDTPPEEQKSKKRRGRKGR